ncbi:MAG TPA: glutamate--tRNA ligase, partial [Nocardioidaceae bacterium]
SVEDLADRMVPYLQRAGVLGEEVTSDQRALLAEAAPLVHERMGTLGEAVEMLGFLFVDESRFERDPADSEKMLDEDGRAVVKAAHDALAGLGSWETTAIEAALRQALVEDLGLKPRHAFGPVRVAVTGRRISPPLFESLELLGRERSLSRLLSAQGV